MEKNRLLIVDDDSKLRSLLTRYLTEQGYVVDTLADAMHLDRKLARNRPDLLILDIMLPEEDGLTILKRLRNEGETIPIIMLTAKDEDTDRIVGLETGADDYIAKPFNTRELCARIQSVLRRFHASPALSASHDINEKIQFGEFVLNLALRELHRLDGQQILLTSAEFALLSVFVRYPRRPLTREQLMELAMGKDTSASLDRSVDVHVSRLRKALSQPNRQLHFIRTVWGHGYMFVPDGATLASATVHEEQ